MNYQEQLYYEFQNEESGLWFVSDGQFSKIIIKAPSNLIRSIINGCKTDFLFGRELKSNKKFIHTGVRINDDPINFAFIVGTHRFIEEHISLKRILQQTRVDIELYNELDICVAVSMVELEQGKKEVLLTMLNNIEELYVGEFSEEASSSLDCFVHSIDPSQEKYADYKVDIQVLSCSILPWQAIENHFIGENEIVKTKIDDNEGSTFENQVWVSLINLFKEKVYKNPIVKYPSVNRELTDILAFHRYGIFLIETKALSVFTSSNEQSMDRKVATVKGHIRKAIRQIIGAVRNVRKGIEVYSSDDNLILFDRNILPHCIIVVSEIFVFNDLDDIVIEMMKTMIEEKIYLHVMDFKEFMKLIKFSSGKKEYFDYFLMQRAEAFVEAKSLFFTVKVTPK